MSHSTAIKSSSRFGKLLGVAAAVFLAVAPSSFGAAFTGLQQIQMKLPAGVVIPPTKVTSGKRLATVEELRVAALAAIAQPSSNRGAITPVASIVTAALARLPQYAADLARAGLTKVYAFPSASKAGQTSQNAQANTIIQAAIKKGLATYTGKNKLLAPNNKYTGVNPQAIVNGVSRILTPADLAAAITYNSVNVVKGITTPSRTSLNAVQTIVKGAVTAGIGFGGNTFRSGSAGAIAGAIISVAGAENGDLSNGDTADAIIKSILKAAAQGAPTRALQIAEAAGFALANAYLQTKQTTGMTQAEIDAKNSAAIVAAIQSGLSKTLAKQLAKNLMAFVKSGITKAYSDPQGNGAGVNGVAFNNKLPQPVTPITPQ